MEIQLSANTRSSLPIKNLKNRIERHQSVGSIEH